MRLVEQHALIDEVLDAWAPALGAARGAYGGHAYRVFNFARRLLGSERHDNALALASAFHDLGIWSDGTFDYLEPSIRRAVEHVHARHPELPAALIAELIRNHHLVVRARVGPDAAAIEAFRSADLVDVSGGFVRAGLDAGFVRDVALKFPYLGLHGVLLREALSWCVKHPLRPMPMLRLRQSAPVRA